MNRNVIIDCRCFDESIETLNKLGFGVIKMPKCDYLAEPVSAHPDMSMVKIDGIWFVTPFVHNLLNTNGEIIVCDREAGSGVLEYPNDVYMNCAVVGRKIICNRKYIHYKILSYAESHGYEIIHVNQGYAKCSVCIVNENSIITEDESVLYAAKENGLEVLLINKGEVKLDGYDYGFIGGCCGLIENNLLAFNGNIELHSDYNKIYNFCIDCGVDVISLSKNPLYDIGTIIRE